jgi:hypothetical protein
MTTLFAYNGCRFQLQRDRYGRHRWCAYTRPERWSAGIRRDFRQSSRHDATRSNFREQIARAPIIGEG